MAVRVFISMLNIKIICVGKLKEHFYIDAETEYMKRLAGYCKPEIIEIPEQRLPAGSPSPAQISSALEKERTAIMRAYGAGKQNSGTLTIALCIEGLGTDSEGLSDLISERAAKGMSQLYFVIGGSFGLHDEIKNKADIKLSLSKMTFPHNLARVILLEQIYRSFKISEGGKYHK